MTKREGLHDAMVMYLAIGAIVLTAPLVLAILLPLVAVGWLAVKCWELFGPRGWL